MKVFKDIKLSCLSALLSVLTLLLFHLPFFRHAAGQVESGFNGVFILAGLGLILLAGNYMIIYLLLYLGRIAGKVLVGFFYFIGNSIAIYFINTYDVMLDDTMMGNVLNTNNAEATSYWSWGALLYIVLMGVLPCIIIFASKVNFGSLKRLFTNIGVSLLLIGAVAFGNMSNWTWIDKNSTVLGSLILPWSYIVNTFRYRAEQKALNREEIKLPDATFADCNKTALVIVIGESSRQDHYSLYGYHRQTNPLLTAIPGVKAFVAQSSATYTIGGVKAILEYEDTDELYEILPNYMFRTGADVIWRSSNWGEPPVHIEKFTWVDQLSELYPEVDKEYDCLLTAGLKDVISGSDKDKVLVILHTSTSHGPSYNTKYPAEFEVFKPTCNTVEMAKAPHEELINAYDNTIVYTDWLLSEVISELQSLQGWKTGMIFVSDHGESLGENNLYMHGVPMAVAPREQIDIPFIVWTSDDSIKDMGEVSQHHVFHSALHFLGVRSSIYDENMNIFK